MLLVVLLLVHHRIMRESGSRHCLARTTISSEEVGTIEVKGAVGVIKSISTLRVHHGRVTVVLKVTQNMALHTSTI